MSSTRSQIYWSIFGPNFHLVLIQPKIPSHLVERAVPTRSLICRRAGHQIWARTCFSRLMEEFVIWEDSGPQTGLSFFTARLASSCNVHANQSHLCMKNVQEKNAKHINNHRHGVLRLNQQLNQYTLAATHKILQVTTDLRDHHQININVCDVTEFC